MDDARLTAILDALTDAGDSWVAVARALPEFARLSRGKPSGPGLHRPWVMLQGEHDRYDMPLRVVRYENGRWFHKGQYMHDIERTT